ncbi:MAG: hypothetical protein HDR06_04485 [Lachnospiraceae bacterium]|nr:hypothetical protein [Lachnospiraceae bacterium]
MYEHKIEDYTFVLYDIMFYGEKPNDDGKCDSLLCERGKCICIDHEQTGLLRKLLSEEDQIVLPFEDEWPFSLNLQNILREENRCAQSEKKMYRNIFFPEYEEIVFRLPEAYYVYNHHLLDVIKSIPILYTTNSMHKIKERDSLIYLCRYAPCAERYLSVLLRGVICRTIGCCKNAETPEEKEAYARKLVKSLNRLKTVLNQNDKKILYQCIDNVNTYISKWDKLNSNISVSLNLPISHELMVYWEELNDCTENLTAKNEDGRHDKLYCLLKKILETADIRTTDFPELPFAEYKDAADIKTDYDKVIDILDHVKHDTNKLEKIWTILSRIFWSGEDIPTDEMEKMIRIADF